ncbi:ricin-type beta-trefoil lectin domain protein [Pendulispora albinea]|uniref:RICIN domain-containing protein n=1 Tax=Pendulispora albinea TaxID=2741071 RepID=A0ABZ2MA10_9BACT
MRPYILQSGQNPNLCVGVSSLQPGAPVILTPFQPPGSPFTQWYLDGSTGRIVLAANPSLCLDASQPGNQLFLNSWTMSPTQFWNWLGAPSYIINYGYPQAVIDNSGASIIPGNPILLWGMHGGVNQRWSLLQVPAMAEIVASTMLTGALTGPRHLSLS